MLVWPKPRAAAPQRRAFRTTDAFEPPALVREILQWTSRLRPLLNTAQRDHLFVAKDAHGVTALSRANFVSQLEHFEVRHGLAHVALACLRPSVLTQIYRATGDLQRAKTVANHACISTTIGYLDAPQVEAQNRGRVATLQRAFLGHFCPSCDNTADEAAPMSSAATRPSPQAVMPPGTVVSMFGFGCKDPFAGVAPGTRRGELCTNFLGCLTCPNALIAGDAPTLARLLQARDHLRDAAAYVHPARWEAIYAPQLRLLEEDILSGFATGALARAEHLRGTLPPLPPLR